MKKITLLTFILIGSFCYAQELVTNGDFETGVATPWYGNAANAVDDGSGNFVNEANITAAGTPFSVNLSQEIVLESGKTYEITFNAYTDTATGTRGMVVGLGQTADPFSANLVNPNPILIETSQTYTYSVTVDYGDAVPDRVIFDMGAETGFVFIDNVSVQETVDLCNDGILNNGETEIDCGGPNCDACPNPPTTAAPLPPARDPAEVFAVYSDAYTAESSSIGAFGGGSIDDYMVGGDNFLQLSGAPGANVQWEFGIPNGVDLSGFTHYHMDYFFEGDVPDPGAIFQTIIQGFDNNSNFTGNTLHNVTPTVTGSWLSLDIPISTFNGGVNVRNNVGQMQLVMAGPEFGPTYIDNVYFHNNTVLSTNEFELIDFTVSPNPTNNVWNVRGNDQTITSVVVFDLLGKEVIRLEPKASEANIDASGLTNGIYLAKISSINGTKTIKLVKE
ncbi:T9SS type A sorting domain-containing protein [Winogradskyella ursingii]|uniref:T9SS type A sorting domain-containing protein n=1 Tax=Winogradskyella ursingii TaxID=2686079 RepID=UPI0015CCED8E|nr:T9SS type A sorting domain-containing protein [Winogradskyella ursingii]